GAEAYERDDPKCLLPAQCRPNLIQEFRRSFGKAILSLTDKDVVSVTRYFHPTAFSTATVSSSGSCHRDDSIQNDCKELAYAAETGRRLTFKEIHKLHAINDDELCFLNSYRVYNPVTPRA